MTLLRNRWFIFAAAVGASVLTGMALRDFYALTDHLGRTVAIALAALVLCSLLAIAVGRMIAGGVLIGCAAMPLALLVVGGFSTFGALAAVAACQAVLGLAVAAGVSRPVKGDGTAE